jgi:hypothetical protein
MNTTFRAGWLAAAFVCATGLLSAQNTTQEELIRADKQFDLYAYNLALHTYETVLKQDPNNTHATSRIAACYFQLNKPDESIPYFDRAVQRKDVDPDVMVQYGQALMQTGDYAGAKKWFQAYAEGNPAIGKHYADMCDYAIQTTKMDPLFSARNEPLNTESADYSPAFLGTRVVYNSARTDITRKLQAKTNSDWSGSAYNQLFVTQRNMEAGFLQKPAFLRSDLQNAYNEGPVTFSADGKRVVFCRNNFIDGTRQIAEKGLNMSLYTATVAENGSWENIKPFPYNGSDYACGFPSLSADGNTLLFASNQGGGYGGWDIYVTNWTAQGWAQPRNLGAPLNTPGNEVTPFFDGKNMYFSSDWHPGMGGLDVFRAELGQDEVKNIFHLGPGINSSRDDYGFIYNPDQNIGYLTSNRPGGRGSEDIWQITKKVLDPSVGISVLAGSPAVERPQTYSTAFKNPVPESITAEHPQTYSAAFKSPAPEPLTVARPQTYSAAIKNPAPEPVVANTPDGYEYLQVTDESAKPVPNAEVDLLDCGSGTGRTDGSGKYYFESLSKPSDCHVNISCEGYEDATVSLYSFGKQPVIVAIKRDGKIQFNGKVLDVVTRNPLYGAIVQYQEPGTGKTIQTSTDVEGRYTITVVQGQTYNINYSMDGYREADVKTKPLVTTRGNQLHEILLEKPKPYSDLSAQMAALSNNTAPVQYSAPSITRPTATAKGLVSAPPIAAPQPEPLNGYAIQVAASPEAVSETKLKPYEDLSKYGNIYVKKESGLNKVRLGIYPTKEEADKNLKDMTKQRKYVSAFVVEERGADKSLVLGPPAAPVKPAAFSAPVQGLSASSAKGIPSQAPTPTSNSLIRYSVQLGSFASEKPLNINDYAGIAKYGNVYTRNENGMNKVRVGVFGDYDDAEVVRNQAVKEGFRDPMIVTEKANDPAIQGFLQPAVANPAPVTAPKSIAAPKSSQVKPAALAAAAPAANPEFPYYVKVAALSHPEKFDETPLDNLGGVIEKRPAGKLTNILLGGYADLASAKQAYARVKAKGYEGAFVVKDMNGKLVRQ